MGKAMFSMFVDEELTEEEAEEARKYRPVHDMGGGRFLAPALAHFEADTDTGETRLAKIERPPKPKGNNGNGNDKDEEE